MSRIIGDSACPKCREMGRDRTGNHLILFEDGGAHCNRCGYTVKPNGNITEDYEDVEEQNYTIPYAGVSTLPHAELKARGIRKDVAERFGFRVEYDPSSREEVAYYYPLKEDGVIVGYKKRSLPKTFVTVGDTKGKKLEPMGLSECGRHGRKLIVVGGQDDMAAAYQMLADYSDSKYGPGKYPPSVISLTRGENDIKCISDYLDRIQAFEEVILCLDMDEVGKKSTEALVKLLGQDKCKIMKLSEKDPNDMLKKGKSQEFIDAFFKAKKYTPNGIVEGSIGLDILLEPIKPGVKVDVLPNTMEKLQGFREREMTIILAPAGVGKTTITKEIGYSLNKQGAKLVHVFLEEDLKKTQQSYIAMDNNVHLAKYRRNPLGCVTKEQAAKSEKELIESQLYLNHWGSMSPDEVMEKFRYGASWGANFGLLDHISMVFSGTETTNERKEIDLLLTKMAAFTRESGMHLVVISHIKRDKKPFRKKEDYPYWETVASDAARGSGAFEQLADNIITLEVEYLNEDFDKGRIRTRVAKNREWSTLGVGDVLLYDMATGRIEPEVSRF